MDGYVIVLEGIEDDAVTQYWGGTNFSEELDDVFFFQSKADAKRTMGGLQAQYVEGDVIVKPATMTITIK